MEDKQESEILLEELMERAKAATEPGEIVQQPVIHKGDEALPTPMAVTELKSAGYVYIYDTITGERSLTNRNMLPTQLKKKRSDGSTVFTTINPKIEPKRGDLKCMLHPESPNRWRWDEMGLAVCMKANLTSPYQVRRHMQKRHPTEWATIEEERLAKEREEDRLLRKKLLKSAVKEKK